MSFPSTSVLDNFNRADEGPPPSASWSTDIYASVPSGLKVVSNACSNPVGADATAWWNASTFGPDTEVHIVLVVAVNKLRLWMRLQGGVGTSSVDGYLVEAEGGLDKSRFFRVDNAAQTQLGADISNVWTSGDSFGGEIVGSTITAYQKTGSWASLGTRSDSTYSAAGNIGIGRANVGASFDDFGGGTISAAAAVGDMGFIRTDRIRSRRTSW